MKIKRPNLGGSGFEYLNPGTNTIDGHTRVEIAPDAPASSSRPATRRPRETPDQQLAKARNFLDIVKQSNPTSPVAQEALGRASLEFLKSKGVDVGSDGQFDMEDAARVIRQTFGLRPDTPVSSVPFLRGDNGKAADGLASPLEGRGEYPQTSIKLRQNMPPSMQALTLLHEAQHAADAQFTAENPDPRVRRGKGHFLSSPASDEFGDLGESGIVSKAVNSPDQLQATPYPLPADPDVSTPEAAQAYLMRKIQGQE